MSRLASRAVTALRANGRFCVRATWRSKSWSAQSLATQPALRIRNVPSVNRITVVSGGLPADAIQMAHRVGQSSSNVPMGLSARISWM